MHLHNITTQKNLHLNTCTVMSLQKAKKKINKLYSTHSHWSNDSIAAQFLEIFQPRGRDLNTCTVLHNLIKLFSFDP